TDHDLIDVALVEKAKEMHCATHPEKIVDFIPADSSRKRATISASHQNKEQLISLGAPQVILSLCKVSKQTKEKFEREVETLAKNGYRALALAVKEESKEEKNMQLVGLFALSDTLRDDAKSVIQFLKESSIGVSMVTGDNKAIAAQIGDELALDGGKVITKDELEKKKWDLKKE